MTPYKSNKLQPKTVQCIFLGFASGYKGYICYNPRTKKCIISRHVFFDETLFPYATASCSSLQPQLSPVSPISANSTTSAPVHLQLTQSFTPSTLPTPVLHTSSPSASYQSGQHYCTTSQHINSLVSGHINTSSTASPPLESANSVDNSPTATNASSTTHSIPFSPDSHTSIQLLRMMVL
ncbi:hypothetical protein M0R45_014477 [Rubus argutus]|uniref:Retroviral polymerase SH3-like domain-containing protein n=1 Tax=Rubus argutus TaxID=59490 RepID=A0AAW1XMZ9_RUBAR